MQTLRLVQEQVVVAEGVIFTSGRVAVDQGGAVELFDAIADAESFYEAAARLDVPLLEGGG